jgi:hypothetical protein
VVLFPEGTLSTSDSAKNFRVEASDGDAGTVSWASYAPGESYLLVASFAWASQVRRLACEKKTRLLGAFLLWS